jgi:hypothetical protein
MKSPEPDDKPKRVVMAPSPTHPGLQNTIITVECAADEDIAWSWTETAAGRFVSGYQLVPRMPKWT